MTTGLRDSASACPSPSSCLVNSLTSFLTTGDMETRGRDGAQGDGGRGCGHRVDQADLRRMRLGRAGGETM